MEPALLIEKNVNPKVWADEKTLGWAQNAVPQLFPHQKQYPLKPKFKEWLKPIIEKLKKQGLLIPCNSPGNTPILGVKKVKW